MCECAHVPACIHSNIKAIIIIDFFWGASLSQNVKFKYEHDFMSTRMREHPEIEAQRTTICTHTYPKYRNFG